jgi:hypothetical protein
MTNRGPDDPLMRVHLSDLLALVQTADELAQLLGAIGQVPPMVNDAAAVRAARGLTRSLIDRLTTLPHVPGNPAAERGFGPW